MNSSQAIFTSIACVAVALVVFALYCSGKSKEIINRTEVLEKLPGVQPMMYLSDAIKNKKIPLDRRKKLVALLMGLVCLVLLLFGAKK